MFMCVCHQGKAIWHESEARWLSLRTLFATLPGVKVTNVTCLCGSDTRGELFGTRVRQGGIRSGRYLLHFREPRCKWHESEARWLSIRTLFATLP